MSVTQDYKTVTLTRFQCMELIAAAERRREVLMAIWSTNETALREIKNVREALANAITELSA